MKVAWSAFSIWLTVLVVLCLFANWPRDIGIPSGFIVQMGFPLLAAQWTDGHLEIVRISAIVVDALIWLAIIIGVPMAIGRRRAMRFSRSDDTTTT